MSEKSLGEFEKLILLAILHLGPEAYGATVIQEVERRTGRTASPGAAYVALRRLERKDLVSSRLGDPSPQRGGRPKRYFAVRPAGLQTLQKAQSEWSAMTRGLEALLEPEV